MGATLKLNNFIESQRRVPFEWGINDCALFVASAVEAVIDIDYAEQFRGRYATKIGSLRVLRDDGYDDLEQFVTASVGEPCAKREIARGDICLFETPDGESIGICVGVKIVSPGEGGLVFTNIDQAIKGWKYG